MNRQEKIRFLHLLGALERIVGLLSVVAENLDGLKDHQDRQSLRPGFTPRPAENWVAFELLNELRERGWDCAADSGPGVLTHEVMSGEIRYLGAKQEGNEPYWDVAAGTDAFVELHGLQQARLNSFQAGAARLREMAPNVAPVILRARTTQQELYELCLEYGDEVEDTVRELTPQFAALSRTAALQDANGTRIMMGVDQWPGERSKATAAMCGATC